MSVQHANTFQILGAVEDVIVRCLYDNISEFKVTYDVNRNALLAYKFWRDDSLLPPFCDLPIIPIQVDCRNYSYYEKNRRKLRSTLLISKTAHAERTFFLNLDKPLLVENELDVRNWEYLHDNVRRSEDYGGDNHVYLSYDDINEFLLLLCVEDITKYLSKEKFIFLFGSEKKTDYPMDLMSEFNIDYTDMKPSVIRVEEINRIFVNSAKIACTGNTFFMGVLDFHKDILSVSGFELSDFVFIYRNALINRTVAQVEDAFINRSTENLAFESFSRAFNAKYISEKCQFPTEQKFFECLKTCFENEYKPKEEEWLKGIFLAYSMAIGRNFTGRISPAIKFETHFGIMFPEEEKRWMYNKELFCKFKYCKTMVPIRYFVISQSSMTYKWIKEKRNYNCIADFIVWRLLGNYIPNSVYNNRQYVGESILLRFEDFKLYPKAALHSLCEYLDIPWDDMLLKITANGTEYMAYGTGAFDPSPLKKRYYNVCNSFDYYRIELVMSKYWKHFGYEPLFYKGDDIYTEEEILKMFELPFQCEQYITDEKEKARIPTIRKHMYELLKKRLHEGDAPLDENGQKMIPIPWLKPKMEYVDGELYH